MKIDQLETFVAVAETLSFSAPCDTLFVTQSTVTKRIKSLENELGAELFRRTTNAVAITPEGEALLPHARAAAQAASAGIEAVREVAARRRMRLKIGYQHINTDRQTPTLLGRFAEAHGGCSVDVSFQPDPDTLMADALSGELDGVFFSLIDPAERADGLSYLLIAELEELLILSKEHRLAKRSSIRPEDLRGETILCQSSQMPAKTSPLTRELQERDIEVDLSYNSSNVNVERLVQMNRGIAPTSSRGGFLPGEGMAGSLESTVVVPVETDYRMHYYFCWRKTDRGLAREFAEYLESAVSN